MRKGAPSRIKRWISVLVVFVIFLLILLNRHGFLHLYQLRTEQERLEVEIARLHERTTRLRHDMASLQSDLTYIERLAREKYRMVKRGEKIFRVMQNQAAPVQDEGEKIQQ